MTNYTVFSPTLLYHIEAVAGKFPVVIFDVEHDTCGKLRHAFGELSLSWKGLRFVCGAHMFGRYTTLAFHYLCPIIPIGKTVISHVASL